MDIEHRRIIREKQGILCPGIDVNKLKPSLLKFRIFTSVMLNDITNSYELFRELPTRGPHAFENFTAVLKREGYDSAAEHLTTGQLKDVKYGSHSMPEAYNISSDPLGYCLIINNVDIKGEIPRHGSDYDAEELHNFFQEIGYFVQRERNLTTDDMLRVLQKFAEKKEFSDVDSCIVIILSYGTNKNNFDIIFGTDGDYITKDDVYNFFSTENCRKLYGKPKMFFFQSCRDKFKDYSLQTDATASQISTACPDSFIVHSSLPYNESYQSGDKGSWFIQYFLEVLSKNYRTHDLKSIMLLVNKMVKDRIRDTLKTKQALNWDCRGMDKCIVFHPSIISNKFTS